MRSGVSVSLVDRVAWDGSLEKRDCRPVWKNFLVSYRCGHQPSTSLLEADNQPQS